MCIQTIKNTKLEHFSPWFVHFDVRFEGDFSLRVCVSLPVAIKPLVFVHHRGLVVCDFFFFFKHVSQLDLVKLRCIHTLSFMSFPYTGKRALKILHAHTKGHSNKCAAFQCHIWCLVSINDACQTDALWEKV